jgi:hypothetical protein
MLVLATAMATPVTAQTPASAPSPTPVVLPHAGISLALPAGFEQAVSGDPMDVVRAVQSSGGQVLSAISITTVIVSDRDTAESVADQKVNELSRRLAIRHLQILSKVEMPVAGQKGATRLLSYTFRGQKTFAAQVFFLRQPSEPKVHLCYVLTVECTPAKQKMLLGLLGDLVKSIKLIPLQRPCDMPVTELGDPLKDPKRGYTIRPPAHWPAEMSSTGFRTGLPDFTLDGRLLPTVRLAISEVPENTSAQTFAEKMLDVAQKSSEERNIRFDVISKGAAKMADKDAWQFVVRQTELSKDASQRDTVIIVQRTVCVPRGQFMPWQSYTLAGIGQNCEPSVVVDLVNKLAEGMEITAPESASNPASKPDEETAGEPASMSSPASEPATMP